MAIAPISAMSAQFAQLDAALPNPAALPVQQGPGNTSFGSLLETAVTSVNDNQLDARNALQDLASGESVDLHGTMIQLEKAEISLRAMTSVRDRLMAAYEQVMNMAI